MTELKKILSERILILDGAMGTMLQSMGAQASDFNKGIFADHPVPLKGDNDVLNITRPDLVKSVHEAYLKAGADIVETNTFNSSKVSQEEYGLTDKVYDLAFAGARCAKESAEKYSTPEKPRFAAGSIGPTSKTLSMSPSVEDPSARSLTFDEMADSYRPGIEGLIDGGVDILLIETVFDTLNAKAALYAAEQIMEEKHIPLPVIFSATIGDASGRMLCGQSASAFVNSISHGKNLLAVGFNCGLGAREMHRYLEEISPLAKCCISAYPNAGLPDESGKYVQTPEIMARDMLAFAKEGLVNIAGGCCGTTPAHIAAVAQALKDVPPRKIPDVPPVLRLSGLDLFTAGRESNFINIGERTNVAGSRKFLKLVNAGDMPSAMKVAADQIENGASIIDINMDDALLDGPAVMKKFLLYAASEPEIARVPVMVDSSNWEVVTTALKCIQGRAIVNSISLKEGEELFLKKAAEIRRLGAAVLVMAFDEEGQADTLDRRVSVLSRSYDLLTGKAGFAPEDIVFDPNVFAVATGMKEHDRYAVDFIEAVRILHKKYPLCGISGGISNVSFSFRGNDPVRSAIHTVFLKHAVDAGLTMGIVNAAQLGVYSELDEELRKAAEDVVLARDPEAGSRLAELAGHLAASAQSGEKESKADAWRQETLESRIRHALVKGDDSFASADMKEALQKWSNPVEIVEGPLMDGMGEVGNLFSSGRMFLPQVVKSARVMKHFVAELMPSIEAAQGKSGGKKTKVVIATVKGDVHDIGKNIASVVLQCNNCTVSDLGVMVPAAVIADAAEKEHADMVGLSGLITPSLSEMAAVVREFERRGLTIPVLVGGAATSELHTALKLRSKTVPVIHVHDASAAVPVVSSLMNSEKRSAFLADLNKKYDFLAESAGKTVARLVPFAEAEKRAFQAEKVQNETPAEPGVHAFELPVSALEKWIDWKEFVKSWDMPSGHKHECSCACASELLADAKKMLAQTKMTVRCAVGIFPANSRKGELLIFKDETRTAPLVIPTLRQQTEGSLYRAVSDWIMPEGTPDWLGMFAVSVAGADEEAETFRKAGDDYSSLLVSTLSLRLAEAAAEVVHRKIRRQFWGFEKGPEEPVSDILKGHYRGIRPAPGYPDLPDHSIKRELLDLIDGEANCGIRLTESYMMMPQASVCAFVIAHPDAVYSSVGPVGEDQQTAYSRKRQSEKTDGVSR